MLDLFNYSFEYNIIIKISLTVNVIIFLPLIINLYQSN